jgi:hypothetical protein
LDAEIRSGAGEEENLSIIVPVIEVISWALQVDFKLCGMVSAANEKNPR